MEPGPIRDALRRSPFLPFRVLTTHGAIHDVAQPGNALLVDGRLLVATDPDPRGLPRRSLLLDLGTVAGLQPLGGELPPASVDAAATAMDPEVIRDLLRAAPFEPFRLCISDGSQYDVRHPEVLMVTRRQIAIAAAVDRRALPRSLVLIDPIHVTRLEPLPDGDEDGGGRQAG